MPAGWISILVVTPLTVLLVGYALRPRVGAGPVAPLRLAGVRAVLAVGGFAVVMVEALGALGALTAPALGLTWLTGLLVAAASAAWRWHRDGRPPLAAATLTSPITDRLGAAWDAASRPERLAAGTVGGLLLADLVVALLAEPNNFDSQTYHLPKVEHWVSQGSLQVWPTAIHRQVTIPPGAEYLLLHLRLLTGGDALYNLVQWLAGVGCLLIVTRVVAQLGGGRRAQVIAAFLVGTTPMVLLQATSTQTDLVVAAWSGCVATLALDGLTRTATPGTVLALGAATGLTAITKTSGLLGAGPMLILWGLAQLRLAWTGAARRRERHLLRTVAASLAILTVAGVVIGPFLMRVASEFGHPLGPPRLRESIPMQRHDPGSVLVNGLRIGHTALDTPFPPVRSATASAIVGFAELIGVDPQDRATTFGRTTFPVPSWYPDEDRVAFPLAGALALVAGGLALARPRLLTDRPGPVRAYAVAVGAALLLYVSTIKWQPWGNRLLLFILILAAPLVGLWLDGLFQRRRRGCAGPDSGCAGPDSGDASGRPDGAGGRRSIGTLVAAVMLAASALAGVLAISYGFPRRLVGTGSVLTTDPWPTRFLRRPQWADEFRWAAAEVDRVGARRIGLVQQNDNWEYPWWLLLPDREIVALQSVLPERPPADPASVDAIVCTGRRDVCAELIPTGWRAEFRGYVGYAVPDR